MKEKKVRGKKKELPDGRKFNAFLDEKTIFAAYKIGGGSTSRGLRIAVAAFEGGMK